MAADVQDIVARQLWNLPDTTSTQQPHCTPFILPSNGVIQLGDSSSITLTTDVTFQPECTGASSTSDVFSGYLKDPFYASTIPMVYVIAAATVIAWVLVVMLTITPRTNFFGHPISAPSFTNAHGIIGGANGGNSGLSGSGSRPWLQKVAALAVAISLTIATADTLEVAEHQYYTGIMDAGGLRKEVLASLEIRIMRVISDIFLWLAQVQTLIRLFPRHKEKVLIKWIGFVLIILDSIFSCLNSFLINNQQHGRRFVDAIPALSYLFELALGLLYAAWVIYYSLTKRRYAFYSPQMRSISLIALLSIVSIITPVVFFVTDVTNQDVAGWGDYFRWVGAAAASVVVWEWVERIEALERDDKKDGILGREVFDGDEMLDVMPSEQTPWSQSRNLRRNFRRHGRDDDPEGGNQSNIAEHGLGGVTNRFRSRHQQSPQHFPLGRAHTGTGSEPNSSSDHGPEVPGRSVITFSDQPHPSQQQSGGILGGPTPPPPVVSPVSRADTTSAASTVYVVRYHPVADVPQPIRRRRGATGNEQQRQQRRTLNGDTVDEKDWVDVDDEPRPNRNRDPSRWRSVPNPFKRKRTSPPQEVQRARAAANGGKRPITPAQISTRWDVRSRLGALAVGTGDKVRDRGGNRKQDGPLPVTIVPAQPRGSGRTWSPDEHAFVTSPAPPGVLATTQEEEPPSSGGNTSTTLTVSENRPPSAQTRPIPRGDALSPHNNGRGSSPTAVTVTWAGAGPPRADDISPVTHRSGRTNTTIVVPAPPRRSPSHQQTSTGAGSATGSHRTPPPHV